MLLPLSPSDKSSAVEASLIDPSGQEFISDKNLFFETFQLQNDFLVIDCNDPCCNFDVILPFHDRVCIAKELLDNFLTILVEQWNEGQLATELSALRQMNHIVLSMLRGENNALKRALDLILSAVIILFDADGSWLEYSICDQKKLLTKGNCETSSDTIGLENDNSVSAEVKSPVIQGRLGIKAPEDRELAAAFLHFMAQECIIVFEIDYLMKLMEFRLTLILGAIESMVLLIDRRMNICYANRYAEELLSRSTTELLGLPVANITAPWNECINSGSSKSTKGIKDSLDNISGNRFVDWGVYPLAGNDDIPGWLVITEDRTEFYRLQEIGERAEKMVNTSNLLGVLAHEIRNPLSTFKGLLQLIGFRKESEDKRKYVGLGIKEVDRVTHLLNDFMLTCRPMDVSKGPIDLKSFLEDMMPLLNGEKSGTSIEIKTSFNAVPLYRVIHSS